MSENSGASKLGFFLAGVGIGAILALLFAPTSGEEARRFITGKAEEGRDYVSAKSKEFRRQAEDIVEKGKDSLTKAKDRLTAAYDAGVKTWQEEKGKSS